jgi:cohesin loading factor subunit SCC2
MSGDDSSGGERKAPPKKARSPAASAPSSVSMLAQVLERVPALVAAHCLTDAQLLQLSALCLTAAFGQGPMALQLAGMEGALAVYTEYEAHRPAVLAELLEKRLSLPAAASREARRSYVLPDGSRVQMFTALMLYFVQSSAALPPSTDTDLALPATSPGAKSKGRGSSTTPGSVEAPEATTPEQAKAAQAAHPWSAGVTKAMLTMLRKVVSQCVEQPQDAEHKALADELVRDVLLLFGRPEWPAAALCVKYIGAMLCNLVRSKEQKAGAEQSAARVFSLDLLGSVLATVAEQRRKHAEAPLVFPSSREVNEEAQPTDAGEDADCICAGGYNGAFMLDCDKCHRWFHGKCVGVAEAEEDLPAEWFCDSCQLSNAVADQRQRITRLLTLPEGGGGSDGEELELGCTEIEVTKQLAMNYLQTTVADPAAASAQQMLLCEWHAEAQEKKLVPLAKLYREQFALVEAARRRQQALSGEERRVPLLTRDGILSASRRLLDHGNPSIFGRLESMLASVLSALNEPQASTRSKAIKALSASVGSDPAVLQMEAVKNGVHRALSDPAISVREATLDLVGQFIAQQPEFIETYYKTIASRLADMGVSVRKRVIKILRDICLRNPGSPRAIDACIHLVSRVSDEEEVQKLVIKTFQELWFAPPIEGRAEMQPHEVAERCRQLVAVTKAAGQRGAPPARAEWLGELLSLLLAEDLERKGMSKKEHTAILRVGTQLVSQLVETLLHESEDAQPDPARLGSVLHALSIFCAARPTMLLPHVELLPTYLQYQHQEAAPAVRHVCEMLPRLLPLLDHPPRKLLEKLEKYLTALIFRVPEESMGGVIRALCAVCQVSKNTQLVGDTLARLCHLLRKQDAAAAPAAAIAAQTMRALLCSGLLCRHFDFDARGHETSALTCDGAHVLTGGKVNEDVFSILLPFTKQTTSAKAVQYAMKGLGHLCIRQPELAVRCKDVLGRALRAGAGSSPVLKQQALANLLMLLKAEQEKSKALREQRAALKAAAEASGTARKTPTEGSLEVEVHATAALTAVLQHHQGAVLHSLLDGREAAVRREGLHVVGAMLTQGLAHPAKCIPYVMALELDVGPQGCAELAKKELRRQYDRYQPMVAAPGAFLDGALRGYQLQRSLAAAAEQQQPQGAARTEAWPAFLYTLLNRKERLVYLKTLLSVLNPGQAEAQEREAPPDVLKRAEWTAQLLARLPFEREEEPLGLVHHINRLLSLHVDGFLDGLKRDLGDSDADAPIAPQELQRALASKQAELAPKCHAAALLCLAHLLKGHLKRLYQLSDAMCQTFDPTDTSSKGRPVTKLADRMVTMDSAALSALPPRFEAALAGKQPKSKKAKVAEVAEGGASDASPPAEQAAWLGVGHYLWLKQLVEEDEAFDFNIIAATHSGEVSGGKRTPAKRPRPKAADGGRGSGRGSGRGGRGGRGSAAKQSKPKPSKKRKVCPFPRPNRSRPGSLQAHSLDPDAPRCSPDAPRCSPMLTDAHRCRPMPPDAPRCSPPCPGCAGQGRLERRGRQ